MITASGLQRIEKCPPSAVLPGVVDTNPQSWRDLGIAVHALLRDSILLGRDAALAAVPEAHREACAAIDLDSLTGGNPQAWATEVAYSWHPESGPFELHRGRGDRDYSQAPSGAICGTADLVGMADDGRRAVVLDLKTGFADLAPPAESLQLGFAAVSLARIVGAQQATVGFVRLINGEGVWRVAHLDVLAMGRIEDRLRAVLDSVAAAEWVPEAVAPVMGTHCRYCPAFLRCPAQMSLARELGRDAELEQPLPDLEHEDVPAILQRLERSEALLARIREHVEAYASSHPVRMPDGRTFGVVERTREGFDATLAAPVLDALGIAGAIETTRELTKASLKRAVQRVLPPAPRGTLPKVLAALREAGAATNSLYRTVDYVAAERLPETGGDATP